MTKTGFLATNSVCGKPYQCPCCGCDLSPYEVFACRLRGLGTPVCVGCLADALVWLKEYLLPMLELALKKLGGEEPVPSREEIADR